MPDAPVGGGKTDDNDDGSREAPRFQFVQQEKTTHEMTIIDIA